MSGDKERAHHRSGGRGCLAADHTCPSSLGAQQRVPNTRVEGPKKEKAEIASIGISWRIRPQIGCRGFCVKHPCSALA